MNHDTRLDSLNIPQLDMVLDEIFNLPPQWVQPALARPTTVGDLAHHTGDHLSKIIEQLEKIMKLSDEIEITPTELNQILMQRTLSELPQTILLDVRERWEYDLCHLEGSILLTEANFDQLLPVLKSAAKVITICHHGVRSLSAALYLREKGVPALSLKGGIDLWSIDINPQLARY